MRELARVRNCRLPEGLLYTAEWKRGTRRDRARIYRRRDGGGSGPSDWGRIGIEATRLHPSGDGPTAASDTRDSNLPTTFRMHYLPSRVHTHIIWTDGPLFVRFRIILHADIVPSYRVFATLSIPHEQCSKTPEVNSKSRDTALINNN